MGYRLWLADRGIDAFLRGRTSRDTDPLSYVPKIIHEGLALNRDWPRLALARYPLTFEINGQVYIGGLAVLEKIGTGNLPPQRFFRPVTWHSDGIGHFQPDRQFFLAFNALSAIGASERAILPSWSVGPEYVFAAWQGTDSPYWLRRAAFESVTAQR